MDDFGEEEVVENPTMRAAYNREPLHQNQPLRWDYEVHLVGEKVFNKVIHLCEICELPILVYGRMLPCKHIFCFDCARKCDKACHRCNSKVQKVEKSALGTVYVCTYGAPKHSIKGCRRTYLSQRDLQSHIAHRHLPKPSKQPAVTTTMASQLPLTQQQAAQQAAQKQGPVLTPSLHQSPALTPVQQPLGPALTPPVASLAHQPSPGAAPINQQMGQSSPVIPGLGDLRPVATMVPALMGHNSPLIQPTPSSMPQSMPYSMASQNNPDIYRPLDIAPLAQQQQQQQNLGMVSTHMEPGQNMQAYGQPAQFSAPNPMMQQQLPSTMHQPSLQHNLIPNPQGMDSYKKQTMPPSLQAAQSRTNVNLITVPIQDEGQFRPLPYVNPSMSSQPNSPSFAQARANLPVQTPPFTQTPMSGSFSSQSTFSQMCGQGQNMTNTSPGMAFNQGGGLRTTSPNMMLNPRPGLASNIPNVPQALAGMVQAISMAAAVRAQGGLLSTPGNPAQGNRFPQPNRWGSPRVIPPRMTQGQQRPRGDGQFSHSNYYN